MDRRAVLTGMSLGLAVLLTGCGRSRVGGAAAGHPTPAPHPSATPSAPTLPPTSATETPHDEAPPQPPQVLFHAPTTTTRQIALTIDDGYDPETVAAYVEFARSSGIHLTFSPNGMYDTIWSRHAPTLKPLIESGQVQIGNHTFTHRDLTTLSRTQIRADIERNEQWIDRTFGTTSRPYLRPPYGRYDDAVNDACASAGFHEILMWNGTFGDSGVITASVLLNQARTYLEPGRIVLGHANSPTVTHLYDRILELIHSRDLDPVTLDEMFGTVRHGDETAA